MKRITQSQPHNIIFDSDVIVTNDNEMSTLDTVLSAQSKRLQGVESNVKWLYKYGGMGTGGGGGQESSSSFKTVLTMDDSTGSHVLTPNKPEDSNKLMCSKIESRKFTLQVYRGSGSTFSVEWRYNDGTGTKTEVMQATESNSYTVTKYIKFQNLDQSSMSITITNLTNEDDVPIVYSAKVIIKTYAFSYNLVYKDTHLPCQIPASGDVFMNDLVEHGGVQARLTYTLLESLIEGRVNYVGWNRSEEKELSLNVGTHEIYFDLTNEDIVEFLRNSNNASYYQTYADVAIRLPGGKEGQYEPIAPMKLICNLIPYEFYIKVSTVAGRLETFSGAPSLDPDYYAEKFNNASTAFTLTIYQQQNQGRTYTVDVQYGVYGFGEPHTAQYNDFTERIAKTINIIISDPGVHYFTVAAQNSIGERVSKTYYFYVNELNSQFTWYSETDLSVQTVPVLSCIYRENREAANIIGVHRDSVLDMTTSTEETTYEFDLSPFQTVVNNPQNYDHMVCIGLQYSDINDTTKPIVTFNANDTDDNKGTIQIFQDKIQFIGYKISGNLVIPKIRNYSKINKDNYHLITIYEKLEGITGDNMLRSIAIYLDGVLEGVFTPFIGAAYEGQPPPIAPNTTFKSFTLHPTNCLVNMIEYSCFTHNALIEGDDKSRRSYLTENNILGHFYSYDEKLLNHVITDRTPDEERQKYIMRKVMYDAFDKFIPLSDNFIEAAEDYTSLALSCQVPIIELEYIDDEDDNIDRFKEWMQQSYSEDDPRLVDPKIIRVKYADGHGSELQYVRLPSESSQGEGEIADFKVNLQGSSTLSYRCKNFELYAPDHKDDGAIYVYSPNFDPEQPSTFLPEQSFTLKADVVDSSHSNNNAMGSFINSTTTQFDASKQEGNPLANHIKNCLTGFPVLVFLKTIKQPGAEVRFSHTYFLGIYNFNLGRKSHFNLGHKDLNLLSNMSLKTGFNIYEMAKNTNVVLQDLIIAEIQGNDKFYDFSQSDLAILFPIIDSMGNPDKANMFGDIVKGSSLTDATVQSAISEFVDRVALGGGYCFTTIGKTFTDNADTNYGYDTEYSTVDEDGIPTRQVPNYMYQFTRSYVGDDLQYSVKSHRQNAATKTDLQRLLVSDTSTSKPILKALDYTSVSEYYVTCMAFGLVDSVQKNMNIKSWNKGQTFYIAFYDMDTCLGVNNNGDNINYKAFSDYWQSSLTGSSEPKILKAVNIYYDFAPRTADKSLYDIPSSYLFAVAKYAPLFLTGLFDSYIPCNIWSKWRQSITSQDPQTGCLKDASTFVANHYAKHLSNVPEAAFNLNYKYKYLVYADATLNDSTYHASYDAQNANKLRGRRITYVTDWLNNRFHILDAYFNMTQTYAFYPTDAEDKYAVLSPQSPDRYNNDIKIIHDVFTKPNASERRYTSHNQSHTIQTLPNSPLALIKGQGTTRYYTDDYGSKCKINININGTENFTFGGSSQLVSIDQIDMFIDNAGELYIDSDVMTTLVGTSGHCAVWTLNVPSIQNVVLTSDNYSGSLTFTAQNPDLNSIDISNTAIGLTITNSKIKQLIAHNMLSAADEQANIQITNDSDHTPMLNRVELNGNFDNVTLPAWKKNIVFPEHFADTTKDEMNCTELNIKSDFEGAALSVTSNNALTSLIVEGFSSVYVRGCPQLKSIRIHDTNTLSSIDVVPTTDATKFQPTFTVYSGQSAAEENIIDLSQQTNLKTMKFRYVASSEIRLGGSEEVKLYSNALQTCPLLQRIVTGDTQLKLMGNRVFNGCHNLVFGSYKANLTVDSSVANIDSMFNCGTTVTNLSAYGDHGNFSGGKLNADDAQYFIRTCCEPARNNITSVNSLFAGNDGISYTSSDLVVDYAAQTCKLMLDFPNLTNASSAFWGTTVKAYNKYMFKNARKVSNIDTLITSGSYTATTDFLEYALPNLTNLSFYTWGDSTYIDANTINFVSVDTSTATAKSVPLLSVCLSSVFNVGDQHPIHLTSLTGLNVSTPVNLSGTFDEKWEDACQYGLAINAMGTKTLSSLNINASTNSLAGLFKDIKLKSITNSFSSVKFISPTLTDITNTQFVDLKDFINLDEDNLSCLTNLFESDRTSVQSMNFNKMIRYADWNNFWDSIISCATNLTAMSYMFQNAYVVNSNSSNELYLNSNDFRSSFVQKNASISSINYLFDGMHLVSSSPSGGARPADRYMLLTHNFLKFMPNLVNAKSAFSRIHLSRTLPYDFFNKRFWQVEQDKFIYDEDEKKFYPAKLYRSSYHADLKKLNGCFKDIEMSTPLYGFDPTHSYNAGEHYDSEHHCLIDNHIVKIDTSSGSPIEVPVDTMTYYNEEFLENPQTLARAYEVTDCEDLSTSYTKSLVATTDSDTTSTLKNFDLIGTLTTPMFKDQLFVAPDIMYGLAASGSEITEMFANTLDNDFDFATNDGDHRKSSQTGNIHSETFTGAIPRHMMAYASGKAFSSMMKNINIMPHLIYTETTSIGGKTRYDYYYSFVPANFTVCDDLTNAFNFRLFAPPSKTSTSSYEQYVHYCMLQESSIPYTMTSLNNGLPTRACVNLYTSENESENDYLFYKTPSTINLTIMNSFEKDEHGQIVINSGIDLDKFNQLRLNGIFNEKIIRIMSGNVVTPNSIIDESMGKAGEYILPIGNHGQMSRDAYMSFPEANERFIAHGANTNKHINKRSVLNYTSIEGTAPYMNIVFV